MLALSRRRQLKSPHPNIYFRLLNTHITQCEVCLDLKLIFPDAGSILIKFVFNKLVHKLSHAF